MHKKTHEKKYKYLKGIGQKTGTSHILCLENEGDT